MTPLAAGPRAPHPDCNQDARKALDPWARAPAENRKTRARATAHLPLSLVMT